MNQKGFIYDRGASGLFPAIGKGKWSAALSALLFALITVLAYFVIQVVISLFFSVAIAASSGFRSVEEITEKTMANASLMSLVSNAVTLICVVIFILLRKKSISESLCLSAPSLLSILPCIILGVALNFFADTAISLIPFPESVYETYDAIYSFIGEGDSVIEMISIVIMAPIAEEIVFRSLCYGTMKYRMPKALAAAISALLFAAAHGNLLSLVFTFVLGAFLAAAYEITGSLIVSILIHASFNASSYIVSAVLEKTPDGYFIPICAVALLLSAAAAYLVFLPYIRSKKKNPPLPDGERTENIT